MNNQKKLGKTVWTYIIRLYINDTLIKKGKTKKNEVGPLVYNIYSN